MARQHIIHRTCNQYNSIGNNKQNAIRVSLRTKHCNANRPCCSTTYNHVSILASKQHSQSSLASAGIHETSPASTKEASRQATKTPGLRSRPTGPTINKESQTTRTEKVPASLDRSVQGSTEDRRPSIQTRSSQQYASPSYLSYGAPQAFSCPCGWAACSSPRGVRPVASKFFTCSNRRQIPKHKAN